MSLYGGGNPDPNVPDQSKPNKIRECPLCGEKVTKLPLHIQGEHE